MSSGLRRALALPGATIASLPPGAIVVAVCWSTQQLPGLPPTWLIASACAAGTLALGLSLALFVRAASAPARRPAHAPRVLLVLASALLAFALASARAASALEARLAPSLEGLDIVAIGVVTGMPQAIEHGSRFRFRIESCVDAEYRCPVGITAALSWYGTRTAGSPARQPAPAAAVVPAQRWRLTIRLKRPHASSNPGVFDAELRALEEGVSAHGYVRATRDSRLTNAMLEARVIDAGALLERARFRVRESLFAALADSDADVRGVLVALTVGDQAAIPSKEWEMFNRTGVGHLMSISGLHITMLAALGAAAANRVWSNRRLGAAMSRRPLAALLARPYARWVCGVTVAFAYSGLAGWGIPAQRTCWMLAAAGAALLLGRARRVDQVLFTAAAIVCAFDPWAPLAAGFWLSFAAVASIVWFGAARGPRRAGAGTSAGVAGSLRGLLREALRTQFAATVALVPLGVLFFGSVSIVGPLANAIAIPVVSALITPIALAGALALPAIALLAPLVHLAAALTAPLLALLNWLDPGAAAAPAIALPAFWMLALAVIACGVLLAPMPIAAARLVAGLGMLPMLVNPADRPRPGQLWVTALDVGQGSAVLVETDSHRLLYDTGPGFGAGADAGARVVVPYLRARGIGAIDALVVSHLDIDHSGGALSVARALRVGWSASSLDAEHPFVRSVPVHYECRRGDAWQWGAWSFEWLHPGQDPPTGRKPSTNARSCVLLVAGPGGRVLLAGDIESAQERRLLEALGAARVRADVLLAPHHGSATSSTAEFLDAVAPSHALFQLGYRNRFRHPHPKVLARYRERRIALHRSDMHGAVTIRLGGAESGRVTRHRIDARRYWRIPVEAEAQDAAGAAPLSASDSALLRRPPSVD
ncbi:MAG: DNA internalization-related competence protein ComEC/Rec2 [Burkholderiaceae bacterium]|nr:DNA internalization-related competence protein ComEC/Rec2 [Burkholderiaceae bacterium]